jgi:hypothetical protein
MKSNPFFLRFFFLGLILSLPKACRCAPYTLEKRQYRPGEEGTLKVRFRFGERLGPTAKHLYVHSNDKERPKAKLTVKATVEENVHFEPKRLKLALNFLAILPCPA